jgi:hypothetical protein
MWRLSRAYSPSQTGCRDQRDLCNRAAKGVLITDYMSSEADNRQTTIIAAR